MDPFILIVIAAAALLAAGLWFVQYRRSNRLRAQFGPEYQRTVKEVEGSTHKAEAELIERQKRVAALSIRPLSREEHERFVAEWRQVQADFVDDPAASIARIDELLGRVMSTRGYPVSDFDRAAADLSVDHPLVVQHYRRAHEIALRHERGDADTEDLRKAMIHYRELFDELVDEVLSEPGRDRRAGNGRDAEAQDGRPFMLGGEQRQRRGEKVR